MKRHIAYGALWRRRARISGLQEGWPATSCLRLRHPERNCNFILSKIEATGADFDKTLAEAQARVLLRQIHGRSEGLMRAPSWRFWRGWVAQHVPPSRSLAVRFAE